MRKTIFLAVIAATALALIAGYIKEDRGVTGPGVWGPRVHATLPENGGPPEMTVGANFGFSCKLAVDTKLIPLIDQSNAEARSATGGDSTTAANRHSFDVTPSGYVAFEGDTLQYWVRLITTASPGTRIATGKIVLDAPGLLRDYAWRSSVSIATAAADSGWVPAAGSWATAYDQVYNDADGTTMRYGSVKRTSADSTWFEGLNAGRIYSGLVHQHVEDNGTLNAGQQLLFLWWDLSDIPDNAKIVEATIYMTTAEFSGVIIPDTTIGYVAARLDTIAADLAMLSTTSPFATDPRVMNVSWNHVAAGKSTAWSPTLLSRTDWHDFGPRGGTYAHNIKKNGLCFRLDVTDPVQQWVSDKRGQINGPFVLTGVEATTVSYSLGTDGTYTNGNPSLVVRWVDGVDYESPWGSGNLVPIVFTCDDGADEQKAWSDTLQSYGYQPSFVVYRDQFGAGQYTTSQLYAEHTAGANFLYHSATHPSLGDLATFAALDKQLRHSAIDTCFGLAAGTVDTTDYLDFAWPINTGQDFSVNALLSIIGHGYRSARSIASATSPIGSPVHFGMDDYANVYMIASTLPDSITGTANPPDKSKAKMKETLEEYIDDYYTSGRRPLILYAHTNGLDFTDAQVGYLCQIIKYQLACTEMLTWDQMWQARTNGQSFVLPDAVPGAAACYDSLYDINAAKAAKMSQIWLPPFD